MNSKRVLIGLFVFLLPISASYAQKTEYRPKKIDGKPVESRASPMAIASVLAGDSYVKIVYSRPHLRKRRMLGSKQVNYGKLWRLGANEATEVTLTKDINIAGNLLQAGTYAMYGIPEKDEWTIIFNSALGQWGSYGYDEKLDVLRVKAKTLEAPEQFEALAIWFDEGGLNMAWDMVHIQIPIEL